MRIVMMASGTRGDVQPVIALGLALKAQGHTVCLVAGSNFVPWIESYGLEAYPTVNMEALMQSEAGIKWVESPSQLKQLQYMKELTNSIADTVLADILNGTEGADLLIGGFVSEPYLQTVQEKRKVPLISVALQPYRATRSGGASLVPVLANSNSFLNRWMGIFAERLTWSVAADAANKMRSQFGIQLHNASSYRQAVHQIPALYAISPKVVPPIDDANTHTTGYLFLDEAFTPPTELVNFLAAGEAPVYVGFGSMSSSDPTRTIQLVSEALAKVGRRGVLAKGWSGADNIQLPDHVFLLDKAPHSWLFPQMAAVVHHGGAGTTAAGLRAGKPTLIIPHMADQPFWGQRVKALGVGAKPLPRPQLTTEKLTERLKTLLTDRDIQRRAAALGERIRAENGVANAVDWITKFIARQ